MLTNSKTLHWCVLYVCEVKNCHKNKIRTNEPKIWQNNKNTESQPKLSGSYKKKECILKAHNHLFWPIF